MSKPQNACCPGCGEPISFKKFVMLNNFSATNCAKCNTRMEISNRNANAVIAGISGCISAACIVLCSYFGYKNYQSLLGGLFVGIGVATTLIVFICRYAYTHSKLSRMQTGYRMREETKASELHIKTTIDWIPATS